MCPGIQRKANEDELIAYLKDIPRRIFSYIKKKKMMRVNPMKRPDETDSSKFYKNFLIYINILNSFFSIYMFSHVWDHCKKFFQECSRKFS